jgi:hypothetical protein
VSEPPCSETIAGSAGVTLIADGCTVEGFLVGLSQDTIVTSTAIKAMTKLLIFIVVFVNSN